MTRRLDLAEEVLAEGLHYTVAMDVHRNVVRQAVVDDLADHGLPVWNGAAGIHLSHALDGMLRHTFVVTCGEEMGGTAAVARVGGATMRGAGVGILLDRVTISTVDEEEWSRDNGVWSVGYDLMDRAEGAATAAAQAARNFGTEGAATAASFRRVAENYTTALKVLAYGLPIVVVVGGVIYLVHTARSS